MRNLVLDIKREFAIQLEKKNSWGKNEVRELFNNVCIDILAKDVQIKEAWIREYNSLRDQYGRMSSGNQPDLMQIPKDPTFKDIHGHENSAHGYTEGADWNDNPFIDDKVKLEEGQ